MTHCICIDLLGLAKKFVRARCSGRRRTNFLANRRFIQIQTETKVWWSDTYSCHEQYILLFSFVIYFIFKAVLTHWIDIMTHCWVAARIVKHWTRCSLVLQSYDSLSSWELPPPWPSHPLEFPYYLFSLLLGTKLSLSACSLFIWVSSWLRSEREIMF